MLMVMVVRVLAINKHILLSKNDFELMNEMSDGNKIH